ncbi:sensor histidine kinase [Scopulibacillus cellulosilyticus]|uniref:histidine kinase n=1 Tax=Scopulibacillus cellulosilyticus TaxID=2665665 RepID=A0ABW2Q1H2_9BACL
MRTVTDVGSLIPLPFFVINNEGCIIKESDRVAYIFPHVNRFLELVEDLESRSKVYRIFQLENDEDEKIEVNLKTKLRTHERFEVYARRIDKETINILCLKKTRNKEDSDEKWEKLVNKVTEQSLLLKEKEEKIIHYKKIIRELSSKYESLSSIEKLTASIAHEVRNPLTTIKGFTQLIRPYLKEFGKEDYADIIQEEVGRANQIIYEFLNASKPSKPIKQTYSINKLIREVVLLCNGEAVMNNIDLNFKPNNVDSIIQVDVKQIKQVIINILQNAFQALQTIKDKQKKILISVYQIKKDIIISIMDNGKGMNKQVLSKVFQPFFTTKNNGTGIGLPLSLNFVESHGGTITVESTEETGTTFRIKLPIS